MPPHKASEESIETTPLLGGSGSESHDAPRTLNASRTPLPAGQLSVLFFLRFCESASTFCIFPFLEELLKSVIKGGEEEVGYYAGLMDAIRHSISLITVLYWSRMSDKIGRKPILLLGTVSLAASMFFFGLSKTFLALVLSRCIFTALSSNAGTIKSVVGEITDQSNRANAFALLHVPWAAGSSFGAFVGGWLAGPRPWLSFAKHYPYFLPCATMGAISVAGFALVALHLRETLPSRSRPSQASEEPAQECSEVVDERTKPAPLQKLLTTSSVLIPLVNYATLAFLHTCSNTILPLYLALPVNLGGLDMPPSSIGTILSLYGAFNCFFQAFFLGRLVNRFGAKRVFLSAILASVPLYGMYVVNNLVARRMGDDKRLPSITYVLVALHLAFVVAIECGYRCVYIFITAASPNRQSLGSTNGLAQTMVSIDI
ncbi:hypothetical protein CC1G_09183 [Coprinopsis cinerea okayama7|uniref:Major facilitator superfamily (MFS) profile domain-containing protein n=1 Tax=Coprinopsis cinerea (strain Okayama-7 / 130 / ATCC MYA-4618 / FGSC 9003) TaxID=240176 RepID=A8P9V5_COPC7|nr:hypothetical protein CC1G_09183 [Coprinopsis cinerea okayama7\|eukprot:XP_001839849.2 hypothetical protein CC1G_09183 [Coprinopsis cinerea okayama7\